MRQMNSTVYSAIILVSEFRADLISSGSGRQLPPASAARPVAVRLRNQYRQQGAIKPLDYRNMEKDSESNQALLFWGTTNISSSQPEWFHNDVTSERIIKVVVENEGAR